MYPRSTMKNLFVLILFTLSQGLSAKVYDFKSLYKQLGYDKQSNYFGATQDEIFSIESYIDKYETFYAEINNFLRFYPDSYDFEGTTPELAKQNVKDIDNIIKRTPKLPNDIILFRGLTLKWHGDKQFELGEEYFDKAYISTSTSYLSAEYFAKGLSTEKHKNEKKALFALYFEQSEVKGLLIDQGEDEVILPHGQKFRIMRKVHRAEYDYYLVQVCNKSCRLEIEQKEINDWWTITAAKTK